MMSTSYYKIKKPFTSLRTEVNCGGSHTVIAIWVNRDRAGALTVRNDEVADVLMAFRRSVSAVSHAGRGSDGTVVLLYSEDTLEDDTQLISEYGELTTLAELKAKGAVER